jgi:hypothetical protein
MSPSAVGGSAVAVAVGVAARAEAALPVGPGAAFAGDVAGRAALAARGARGRAGLRTPLARREASACVLVLAERAARHRRATAVRRRIAGSRLGLAAAGGVMGARRRGRMGAENARQQQRGGEQTEGRETSHGAEALPRRAAAARGLLRSATGATTPERPRFHRRTWLTSPLELAPGAREGCVERRGRCGGLGTVGTVTRAVYGLPRGLSDHFNPGTKGRPTRDATDERASIAPPAARSPGRGSWRGCSRRPAP